MPNLLQTLVTDPYNRIRNQYASAAESVGRTLNLPEWNVSEMLRVPTANAMEFPVNVQNGQIQGVNQGVQGVTSPTNVMQPINNRQSNPVAPAIQPPNFNAINQRTEDYGALIEREYQDQMNMYAGQEQGLRGEAALAEGQIGTEYEGVKSQLGQEQATREGGVQAQLSTAEKTGTSALQQARDLFRQTQQSNITQLSGLGISSSSVAEALAERLGVETARRIAGITGSLDEVRLNTTKELSRVKDYYQGKLTTLEKEKANQIASIKNNLLEGISKINSARDMAASAKARQRADLYYSAQQLSADLQSKYEAFKWEAYKWAQNSAKALENIIDDPNYLANITNNLNNMNKSWAPPGFSYVPNISGSGQVTGYRLVSTKKPEEGEGEGEGNGVPDYTSPLAY